MRQKENMKVHSGLTADNEFYKVVHKTQPEVALS